MIIELNTLSPSYPDVKHGIKGGNKMEGITGC
jgi:hypothetical protein